MPFQSEDQRKYLHANHPEIAKRWERDYAGGGFIPSHKAGIYGLNEGGRVRYFTGAYGVGGTENTDSTSGGDGGYQNVHDTGAVSQTPGRTTTTTTSTGDGFNFGPDQEEDVARMMKDMGIVDKYNKPDYSGDRGWVIPETDYGAGDYIGPKDKVRIQNDILSRKEKWDKDKLKRDIKTGFSAFTSITNPFSFAKFVYNQNKQKKERIAEIDEDLELLNKIGSTKFSPHRDTIYQQLEQEKLDILQPKTRDTPDGGPDGPIAVASITYDDIEDKNKKERASLRWVKEQEKVDRSKQMAYWRMMMQPYMSAQGGRVPAGYNTGGLSNLFRLKNR